MWWFIVSISWFIPFYSSAVSEPTDDESVAHCTLHYFFDTVMPILQAFFTKFYIPEKELYPAEVENVDKLARALVVSTLFKFYLSLNTFHSYKVLCKIAFLLGNAGIFTFLVTFDIELNNFLS